MEEREQRLPAGEAFRVRGVLTASAERANVRGHYVVRIAGPASLPWLTGAWARVSVRVGGGVSHWLTSL